MRQIKCNILNVATEVDFPNDVMQAAAVTAAALDLDLDLAVCVCQQG